MIWLQAQSVHGYRLLLQSSCYRTRSQEVSGYNYYYCNPDTEHGPSQYPDTITATVIQLLSMAAASIQTQLLPLSSCYRAWSMTVSGHNYCYCNPVTEHGCCQYPDTITSFVILLQSMVHDSIWTQLLLL